MTTAYVIAALILIAAAFFAVILIPSPVRVKPHKPAPGINVMIWKVDLRLWWSSRRNGYIVQHVRINKMVTTCGDPQFANAIPGTPVEFWEAWPVQAGSRTPDRPTTGPTARDFDDAFRMVIPDRELAFGRGRVRQEVLGELRFFPGMVLPNSFVEDNPDTQAGAALSDVAPPPGWRPGGTRHEMTVTWDNCTGVDKWDIQELPKFQE
ncbi:MAG: hypothetical protein Q8M19_19970 [Reyranella sp.]|nr:hypothetical protein [Reyranella sp.]